MNNDNGKEGLEILNEVLNQCLNREDGWKAYYEECMNNMQNTPRSPYWAFRRFEKRQDGISLLKETGNILQLMIMKRNR